MRISFEVLVLISDRKTVHVDISTGTMQHDDTSLAPLITSLLSSYWSIDHDLQMTKISQAFRGESRTENQFKRKIKKIIILRQVIFFQSKIIASILSGNGFRRFFYDQVLISFSNQNPDTNFLKTVICYRK